MNLYEFSPYVRVAMQSILSPSSYIHTRIIYDYELIILSEGEWELFCDGKTYICKKDDIIFLRPNIPHSIKVPPDKTVSQPHIHFDMIYTNKSPITPVSFQNMCDMNDYERSLIQEDIFKNFNIPYVFQSKRLDEFRSALFSIIAETQEKKLFLPYG